MKVFKTTIEASNSCYVQTLLVIAETKEDAHNLIKDSLRDKYNENPRVPYKTQLTEIDIDLSKPGIMQVGFGSNNSSGGGLDYGDD